MSAVRMPINDFEQASFVKGEVREKKGLTSVIDLGRVSREMARLNTLRDQTIMDAFGIFNKRYPTLAALLLQHFRDKKKAARWMCMYQKAFGGRMGYDVIAEGDDDSVWDEIERMG